MNLRPYQQEAREAVHAEWDLGRKNTLTVLPTGTGKTVVFSKIAQDQAEKGGRVLIMAHRGELLTQAADKLKATTGLDCALEKSRSSCLGSEERVVVGSVQTISEPRRLSKFPADYFSDIIVDEAHHCLSSTYRRVLDHFPTANVLGVTATPDRGDKKKLSDVFDSQAYEYTLPQAIKDGYLCPVKAQLIPLELDISSVGISAGDYAAGGIAGALDPYLSRIAQEMLEYCKGRKTVVFLPLIKTSQKFCDLLNCYGLKAAEINGNSLDREQTLKDFENGEYDVLCNSMLLTEGWDCPAVDCVVILRPTKIRSLYQQMVGRGMRPSPGKDHLLLLDFLWLTERHDLCRPSSIISRNADIAGRIDKELLSSGEDINLIEAAERAERNIVAERERALAKQLNEMRTRKARLVDPIQYVLSIAAEDLANYEPTFPWELEKPTQKQLDFLKRRGIDPSEVYCAGLASRIIDRLILRQSLGLSTPKQIRCLERYGFTRVGTWDFDDASRMIGRLAANDWSVPYGINADVYKP